MKPIQSLEFSAGLFLLLGIVGMILLATQSTNYSSIVRGPTYHLTARFSNAGDLKLRAPVTVGGVTVGAVDSISLDPESFEAVVGMRISRRYDAITDDSTASVLTSGILGDQYIGIDPGGSPEVLKDGDEFLVTQSAIVLEQLIGKYMFNSDSSEDKK